jgi:hypothetical protein
MKMRYKPATTLKITRIIGSDSTGKDSVGYLNLSGINPDLADDDLLDIGKKLGNLQAYPVKNIGRLDSCLLVEQH